MTRNDIIRMAREAGFNLEQGFLLRVTGIDEDLERFAALVAAAEREKVMNEPINKEHWQRFEDEIRAAEREACAKVCENEGARIDASWTSCAAAIRARGQA